MTGSEVSWASRTDPLLLPAPDTDAVCDPLLFPRSAATAAGARVAGATGAGAVSPSPLAPKFKLELLPELLLLLGVETGGDCFAAGVVVVGAAVAAVVVSVACGRSLLLLAAAIWSLTLLLSLLQVPCWFSLHGDPIAVARAAAAMDGIEGASPMLSPTVFDDCLDRPAALMARPSLPLICPCIKNDSWAESKDFRYSSRLGDRELALGWRGEANARG
mmetsp:Transcript_48392/g.103665  ORF Transcript_48392/g.103665 Transcript_48392/m.103665 type:complete len:218 (-) Transcript_48392:461-1114(-)